MSAFRDEREAMLERLRQLEEELAGVRDAGKREELLRELSTLANRVEVATKRVDEDARSLDEIAQSIERMRTTIGGAPPGRTVMAPAKAPATPAGPGRWAFVLVGILVAVGFLSAYAASAGRRTAAIDLASPASSIPGFPNAVDPSALVAMAREEARLGKDARLTGIRVDYASSNGRVNLRGQGYEGRVAYSFIAPPVEIAPASSGAPLGAPRPLAPPPRTTTVTVTASGIHAEPMNLLLNDVALADPTCSVEQVWAAVRGAGAPSEAIAVIEYGTKDVFEAGHFKKVTLWRFEVKGTQFSYEVIDPGCQVSRLGH